LKTRWAGSTAQIPSDQVIRIFLVVLSLSLFDKSETVAPFVFLFSDRFYEKNPYLGSLKMRLPFLVLLECNKFPI